MYLIQIGVAHTMFDQAAGTPVQPFCAKGSEGWIEIFPPYNAGLKDLDGFDRIWLLFWCNRATSPKLNVVPYRDTVPHGVFATRAPSRPNPIGMSSVRLLRICDGRLHIAELDLLDGTPILDIKPYVPQYDCYPADRIGWLQGDTVDKSRIVADNRFMKTGS